MAQAMSTVRARIAMEAKLVGGMTSRLSWCGLRCGQFSVKVVDSVHDVFIKALISAVLKQIALVRCSLESKPFA